MFLGLIGDTILTGGKWYFWLGTLCSSDWLVMLIFDRWDFMFLGLIGDAISTGGTDIFDWWDFMFLGLIGDANIGKISCPCHFMISGQSPCIFSETLKKFHVCAIWYPLGGALEFFLKHWKIYMNHWKISMSVLSMPTGQSPCIFSWKLVKFLCPCHLIPTGGALAFFLKHWKNFCVCAIQYPLGGALALFLKHWW